MDRITAGYQTDNRFDGAHVVWEENGQSTIVAIIPEPVDRVERAANWDEGTWRDAVRTAALDAWGEPDSDNPVTIYLVFDPGRDEIEEEIVCEYPGRESK